MCHYCLQVGRARFRAPELLFHPHLIGEESEGIHEVRSCRTDSNKHFSGCALTNLLSSHLLRFVLIRLDSAIMVVVCCSNSSINLVFVGVGLLHPKI